MDLRNHFGGILGDPPARTSRGFQFTAVLNGANETGLGDLDGTGIAMLSIDSATNTIDWNIQVDNIALPLTGAHIHTGAAGVSGSVVVNFSGQ